MSIKIGLKYVRGVPLYAVREFSQHQSRVYGAVRDERNGYWYHPAYYPFHDIPVTDYNTIFNDMTLTSSAEAFRASQAALNVPRKSTLLSSEFHWVTTPDSYQKEAVAHALCSIRSGLFLDCGLGKTKVMIDVIRYLRWAAEDKIDTPFIIKPTRPKVLCVVKSSVLWNWPDEIAKHSEPGEFKVQVLDGYSTKKKRESVEKATDCDFLVATYEQLARGTYQDLVAEHYPYDTLLADESHKMQSWKSSNTQAAVKLSSRAYRRVIATGTATLGDPRHTYGQLHFLAPHLTGGSYYQFCERHLKTSPFNKNIVVGYKGLSRLNAKIHSVGTVVKIDDKIETTRRKVVVPVALSKEQKSLYDQILSEHEADHPETKTPVPFREPITRIGKVHEVCNGFLNFHNRDPDICNGCEYLDACVDANIRPYTALCAVVKQKPTPTLKVLKENPKLDVMLSKLEDVLVDPSNAVIITHRFRHDAKGIKEELDKRKIKYIAIEPTTKAKELHELADTFENDSSVRVFLAQISTLVGINLVRAKYIFFYSLSFDLKDYEQARGRNYRRTQKAAEIFEYIFYTENTVEAVILEALDSKTDIKDLLLTRVDCGTCKFSVDGCIAKKILPWRSGCVLENTKDKVVMRIGSQG